MDAFSTNTQMKALLTAIGDKQGQVEQKAKDLKKLKKRIEAREEELLKFDVQLKAREQDSIYRHRLAGHNQQKSTEIFAHAEKMLGELEQLKHLERKLQSNCQQSLEQVQYLCLSAEQRLQKQSAEQSEIFKKVMVKANERLQETAEAIRAQNSANDDRLVGAVIETLQREIALFKDEFNSQMGKMCQELMQAQAQAQSVSHPVDFSKSTRKIIKQAEINLASTIEASQIQAKNEIMSQGQKNVRSLAAFFEKGHRTLESKIQQVAPERIESLIKAGLGKATASLEQLDKLNKHAHVLAEFEEKSKNVLGGLEETLHSLQEVGAKSAHGADQQLSSMTQILKMIEEKIVCLAEKERVIGAQNEGLLKTKEDMRQQEKILNKKYSFLMKKEKELRSLQEKTADQEFAIDEKTKALQEQAEELFRREEKISQALLAIKSIAPSAKTQSSFRPNHRQTIDS